MLGRVSVLMLLVGVPFGSAFGNDPPKRIAAIVTEYRHNSHADVIVSRLFQTDTLDGKGEKRNLQLVSLYTDQVPDSDTSRRLSKEYDFPIFETVEQTLTLGTEDLAVEGVLLIAEHGKYPVSKTGQVIYPKRRLWDEIVKVFRAKKKVVPVFIDKHLADNWDDISKIYEEAKELEIPLMAGSSLPGLWRYPELDVDPERPLKEILVVSYHTLDAYGFHAMEALQCLAEQRKGGETGIARVKTYSDGEVWKAIQEGVVDRKLIEAALSKMTYKVSDKPFEEVVPAPDLFVVEYKDGLRGYVITLNGFAGQWTAAVRYQDNPEIQATMFYTQEARPFMHFTYLMQGVEKMMHTGKPAWPVERTLLSSGALDALLISKLEKGIPVETPYLIRDYSPGPRWKQPPPPPPDRPIDEQ